MSISIKHGEFYQFLEIFLLGIGFSDRSGDETWKLGTYNEVEEAKSFSLLIGLGK